MRRQPEREQLNRLTVKTLDQVFIMRVKEGLGCSQFEAEALTGLVKEVYFPWLSLSSPSRQVGRVQPFAAQESADLAGIRTIVGLLQDTPLVLGRELAALGLGHNFRIRNVGW